MSGDNWATIIVAVIGLLGIIAQRYYAGKSKQDKDDQTNEIKQAIDGNTKAIQKIESRLGANDVATVSALRQQIRKLYHTRLPYKTISTVDYRALEEMYSAYKAVVLPDGHRANSWCDSLYHEMSTWEKVENYEELNQSNKKGKK